MTWTTCPSTQVPVLSRTSCLSQSAPTTPTGPSRRSAESRLSTKRERTTPRSAAPPKVVRPAPKRSLFAARRKQEEGFITQEGLKPLASPFYTPSEGPFFEQVFHTERPLGKGSFGEVVAARCLEDRRLYAVKASLVPPSQTSSSTRHREALNHLRIPAHPNLVTFFRAWEEGSKVFIQLELCHQTLLKWVEECEGLAEQDVWRVSIDLVRGLNHLHQMDMIHNDIKPENVLVTRGGVCKLGDLGMVMDLKKTPIKEEGDNRYMAPEILTIGATRASDVFSLGVTLLESATDLDVPSNGPEWQELRSNAIPERFGLSKDLRGLIESMMRREAVERPTVEELLEHPRIKDGRESRAEDDGGEVKEEPVPPTDSKVYGTPKKKVDEQSDSGSPEVKENTPESSSAKRRAVSPLLQLTPTLRRVGRLLPTSPHTPTPPRFDLEESDSEFSPSSPAIRLRVSKVQRVAPLIFDI